MSFEQDPNEQANISGADLALMVDEMEALRADAERYRWLIQKMQASYEGDAADDYELTVTCSMLFGRKEVRRVQAEISWFDERDEDLNLSAAIDRAMKQLTTKD